MFFHQTFTKNEIKVLHHLMTTAQNYTKQVSLDMKSEGHYKQAAANYKKSQQYHSMIGLYPILQSTLLDCKGENLVE